MPKNPKNPKVVHCVGLIEVAPVSKALYKSSSTASKGGLDQFETSTKAVYKDPSNGYSCSFDKTHKSGEFVDGRSGKYGYKEALSYKSSVQVDDAFTGGTNEYQTEVKFKKITTYPNSSSYERPTPYSKPSKGKSIGYY